MKSFARAHTVSLSYTYTRARKRTHLYEFNDHYRCWFIIFFCWGFQQAFSAILVVTQMTASIHFIF